MENKKPLTDYDILKEHHRFVPEQEDLDDSTWEKRMARTYHDNLYREYALADLSRYKSNQIALRWRTEQEVISHKGRYICANLACFVHSNLSTWQVDFVYSENGVKKETLVKLRLCESCSLKLNYCKKAKQISE